ncbi:aspartyl-phosphate phosphatase Spo0E family protein [Cytobacillus firmus]|uniref:aspartyl-phosphate phosphatase Spo0E family protein n=1 Tax=Cytobacillus firmus TaxID=1399 RepID=UPI0034A2E4EA
MNLSTTIEQKRDEMIRVGMSKGLCDEETIKISQELDELIYRKLQQNRESKNDSLIKN